MIIHLRIIKLTVAWLGRKFQSLAHAMGDGQQHFVGTPIYFRRQSSQLHYFMLHLFHSLLSAYFRVRMQYLP